MKPRIIFRADGNSHIGLGHLVRSMALANMLQPHFRCFFATQQPDPEIVVLLQSQKLEIISLPKSEQYEAEAYFLRDNILQAGDLVVLDGYSFATSYQRILKQKFIKLVCIDDIFSYHFVADVIINHAPGITANSYSAEPYTSFCLGPEYALLREPFLRTSVSAPEISGTPTSLFVCFGGADAFNLTLAITQTLSQIPAIKEIHVVIGSSYKFASTLWDFKKTVNKPIINIHQNLTAESLRQVLDQCQVAICPASSVLMEVLSCRLKTLTGFYVENQRNFAHYCQENAFCFSLGNFLDKTPAALLHTIQDFLLKAESFVPKPYIVGNPQNNLLNKFLLLANKST
jgi:UDP-2,4-diacetamido-2,4,6-trideoxy-beta-L-altropyranose hydrolase